MGQPEQWAVIDRDHTVHTFEDEAKAWAYATGQAWTEFPTTVRTPGGGEFLIMRRDPRIAYQAVRKL